MFTSESLFQPITLEEMEIYAKRKGFNQGMIFGALGGAMFGLLIACAFFFVAQRDFTQSVLDFRLSPPTLLLSECVYTIDGSAGVIRESASVDSNVVVNVPEGDLVIISDGEADAPWEYVTYYHKDVGYFVGFMHQSVRAKNCSS